MFKDRVTRALHHQKALKPVIQRGVPVDSEGVNGDFRICQIERYVFLCIKYNNKWYNAATGERASSTSNVAQSMDMTVMRGGGSSESGGSAGRHRRNFTGTIATPRAEYDSGWLAANANADITITHNLNLGDIPKSIAVYASNNATPTLGTHTIVTVDTQNASDGVIVELTSKDVLEVHVGASKLWDAGTFGNSSVPSDITNGYIRVLIQR